ncbi:GIY-YIG nuclease family protein [Phenylobacterium hankyongense]|uniref:GIY-YIG nuclease family protein n=1 Tax=Phenylobacterium hankyongense TaxID=1813876 RepID=UPI00269E7D06
MSFFVYILASRPYGTLYTGSTDDLARRIYEHREKVRPGFTSKYEVTKLVWFETFELRENASAANAGSRNGAASGRLS